MLKFWKSRRQSRAKFVRQAAGGQRHLRFEMLETRKLLSSTGLSGDFNGDGFADLAIGAPGRTIGAAKGTGAVTVLYGTSTSGLSTAGNQLWDLARSGMAGSAQSNDQYGAAIAVGDFNGDGYTDLAIGAPGRTVAGAAGAGAVNIIYGSATGLTVAGNQLWTEINAIPGTLIQANSAFGTKLTTGDFNGDGYVDLAISAPFLKVGTVKNAGGVYVLYGSAAGLTHGSTQFVSQGTGGILGTPMANSEFGKALTAGDFNEDGIADLAVGTPNYVKGSAQQAGAVNVIYGTSSGLSSAGNQLWTQFPVVNTVGTFVQGNPGAGALFGWSLTTGDFNNDGVTDLAVGAPGEIVGVVKAGSVNIIYGATDGSGLISKGNQLITRKALGSTSANGDEFGFALAAGNFNGQPGDDLAIGAPLAEVGSVQDAGLVAVVSGSTKGLVLTGVTFISQGTAGFGDAAKKGDNFGATLAAGDYNGDGYIDLDVGSPTESLGTAIGTGVVQTFYGSTLGLTPKQQQLWREGLPGLQLTLAAGDGFGLGVG
ncbi:MAG TPA: hypothetical protein VFE46_03285 [Pirellulales bacterium]|jgi:hypothetical protein|nr:hypothetical protein [Pirellulales bacterium]